MAEHDDLTFTGAAWAVLEVHGPSTREDPEPPTLFAGGQTHSGVLGVTARHFLGGGHARRVGAVLVLGDWAGLPARGHSHEGDEQNPHPLPYTEAVV